MRLQDSAQSSKLLLQLARQFGGTAQECLHQALQIHSPNGAGDLLRQRFHHRPCVRGMQD